MAFKRRSRGKNKYGAVPVIIDGIKFASKLEGAVYQILKAKLIKGEIHAIERQSVVEMTPGCKTKLDFKVFFTEKVFYYVEAKGKELYPFKTYKKQWPYLQKVPLEIYTGDFRKPKKTEIIVPMFSTLHPEWL